MTAGSPPRIERPNQGGDQAIPWNAGGGALAQAGVACIPGPGRQLALGGRGGGTGDEVDEGGGPRCTAEATAATM